MDILFIVMGAAALFMFIKSCVSVRKTFRTAAVFMLSGLAALIICSAVTSLFSFRIAVNEVTVFISLVLGIPGVIMLYIISLMI